MPFSFEIHYTKAADKFFVRHEKIREQFEDAIRERLTGDHPEKVDVKKIQGKRADYYRVRLGRYRVIYTLIQGKVVVVLTLLAGSGGDIYKKI